MLIASPDQNWARPYWPAGMSVYIGMVTLGCIVVRRSSSCYADQLEVCGRSWC